MGWEIGNPIPDDWNDETDGWAVGLFLFPNSTKWGMIVRTVLRTLSRGRFWARDSGTITTAQDAGRLAHMSFTYVSFQELLDAINAIRTAIQSQELAVSVNSVCCEQVTSPVPPTPPATEPPPSSVTDPADIPPSYTDVQEYKSALCLYANAMHWQVKKFIDFLAKLDTVAAILTVIVALLGLIFPEPATTAIGGVTLVTIVGVIVTVDGGLAAVATWADDAVVYWESKQEDFVCFFYQVIFTSDGWGEQVETFISDALNTVSETFPNQVIETAVSWVTPFLEWLTVDLYDGLETLEPHPSPVSCTGCGALPCDTDYPGVAACVTVDYFGAPDGNLVSVSDDIEGPVSWSYGGGIFEASWTVYPGTVASSPGVSFSFPVDPNRTRVGSIVTILEATVTGPSTSTQSISGQNIEQAKPFAFVNTAGSSWRDCVELAVEAEGVTVPGTAGSGFRTSILVDGPRPEADTYHSVYIRFKVCALENDIV